MKVTYLVPSINEKDNPFMYCNYARNHYKENVCKTCSNKCQHQGKITVKERG